MPTRSMVLALSITLASVSAAPTAAGQVDDMQTLREHYDLQDGKRLYEEFCQFCHGESGKGKVYNQVAPPPPDLTAPAVQRKSDADLEKVIHEGEQGTAMGAWKWTLSEKEKQNVLLYLRQLAR